MKDNGYVAIRDVESVFDRLIAIYGTKAKVATALGIHKQGFLNPNKRYIQRRTLNAALELLAQHEAHLTHRGQGNHFSLEVVSGAALSKVLRDWCDQYELEHLTSVTYDSKADFNGPVQTIADRTGYNVRHARRLCNGELPWVSVSVADKMLVAIDQHYLLVDGTLHVVANPNMSAERWVELMEQRGCL